MKAYTDLEQSKKLAEILPLESADMRFCFSHTLSGRIIGHYPMIGREPSMGTVPCWSLAALLTILSFPNLFENDGWNLYTTINEKLISINNADNPVDVCYEMILKLHEQKLL